MRNRYLENFDSLVKVSVCGKNIYRYLFRMMKEKIQVKRLTIISHREIHLIMQYSEYQKLEKIYSVLYHATILNYMGNLKFAKNMKKNAFLLLFMVMGIGILIFLSRVIFDVEVIHYDKGVRELVLEELKKYDICKYHLKKSYHELERIEDKILKSHKRELEWLEISSVGTKYVVRVEERKVKEIEDVGDYQNIVSRKEAILVEVKAIRGEKLKTVHDYVKKGDIVIAGFITLPNNSRVPTTAMGQVLGEVWYTVKMDYPFVYQESKLTGRSKKTFAFYYFGNRLGLFDFQRYRSFSTKNKILFSSIFLNVQFVLEEQYEMLVKDEVYTEDIVKNKAINYIKEKIMRDNPLIKEVVDVRILNSYSDEDSVQFNIFIKAIEDIGEISYFSPDINQNEQKK